MDAADEFREVYDLLTAGEELSAEQVAELEDALKVHENDWVTRVKLLGYYFLPKGHSTKRETARLRHIDWVVLHHPAHPLAGLPYCWVLRATSRWRDYAYISKLWRSQAQTYWDSARVVGNAGEFFLLNKIDLSVQYFSRARDLEPHKNDWSRRLSQAYKFLGPSFEKLALSEVERACALAEDDMSKFQTWMMRVELAFAAGDLERSTTYAHQLLAECQNTDDARFLFIPPAVQVAHTTLGKVCLAHGEVEKAGEHLLQSLPESIDWRTVLTVDRQLAAEVFAAGNTVAVLKWLNRCDGFLPNTGWRETVERGKSPWPNELPEKHDYYRFSTLPRTVFDMGDYEKAAWAANEFIAMSKDRNENRRHTGFGLHTSFVVLGQLALMKEQDIDTAKGYLQKSISVPKSDRFEENGPDLSLAIDLLKLNEFESVGEFLQGCERLLDKSQGLRLLLKKWRKEVKNAKFPDDWQLLLD